MEFCVGFVEYIVSKNSTARESDYNFEETLL